MVDVNIANFITIGGMAIVAYALLMWVLNLAGININWLNG